jgi:hypothetical protein
MEKFERFSEERLTSLRARFNNPRGLAYDEQNNVFYVGDMDNHIIRKIAMEDEDSAHESDEEEISAENTVSNK